MLYHVTPSENVEKKEPTRDSLVGSRIFAKK